MVKKTEVGINVTFTLDKEIIAWLDKKAKRSDLNRSQVGRKIFRQMMDIEKAKKEESNG